MGSVIIGLLKWNTGAYRIEGKRSTTMGSVCRDNTKHRFYNSGKFIGDCPILLTETLTIGEAIRPNF